MKKKGWNLGNNNSKIIITLNNINLYKKISEKNSNNFKCSLWRDIFKVL